jgi:hypothetical protein
MPRVRAYWYVLAQLWRPTEVVSQSGRPPQLADHAKDLFVEAMPSTRLHKQAQWDRQPTKIAAGEIVAAHAVILLEVADDGFDGGAPAHLAVDGLGDTPDLAADPDLEPVRG